MRPLSFVRLETRTAGAQVFILLSIREGLATVLSQTSWCPYRVPLEVVRPLCQGGGRSGEVGVGYRAGTGTGRQASEPVRPLVAVSGGGR